MANQLEMSPEVMALGVSLYVLGLARGESLFESHLHQMFGLPCWLLWSRPHCNC